MFPQRRGKANVSAAVAAVSVAAVADVFGDAAVTTETFAFPRRWENTCLSKTSSRLCRSASEPPSREVTLT